MERSDPKASKAYWNERSERFENEFHRCPTRVKVINRVISLAEPCEGEVMLDLGTGTGRVISENMTSLKSLDKIFGVDIAPDMLEIAGQRLEMLGIKNVELREGLLQDIPMDDSCVDFVTSSLAMHHISDVEKKEAIREFKRVLKNGGRVVIADQMNCFDTPVTEKEIEKAVVSTFFPDEEINFSLEKASDHKEFTCSKDQYCDYFREEGFKVEFEKINDVIGIIKATL